MGVEAIDGRAGGAAVGGGSDVPPARIWNEEKAGDLEALGQQIAELGARIDAAEHLFLTYVREFDQRDGWAKQGCRTMAHWLSWRLGIGLRVAQEKVRIARSLEALPKISEAFSRGEVSYSKVRAMTRVATGETDEELLDIARHTTGADLERVCRVYRGITLETAKDRPKRSELRFVRRRYLASGMVRLEVQLGAEEAEAAYELLSAIADRNRSGEPPRTEEEVEHGMAGGERSAERSDPAFETAQTGEYCSTRDPGVKRSENPYRERATVDPAGASTEVELGCSAERCDDRTRSGDSRSAQRGDAGGESEDRCSAERSGTPTPGAASRSAERADPEDRCCFAPADVGLLDTENTGERRDVARPEEPESRAEAMADAFLYLCEYGFYKASALVGGSVHELMIHADAGSLKKEGKTIAAVLEDGSPLTGDVLRRLACDAARVAVLRGEDDEVLSVGRRTRTIPPAIRRALQIRDGGCRFPGCQCNRHVDGHHIRHWVDGGATSLDNLILLCRYHHRLIHEKGFSISVENGQFVFLDPSGRRIDAVPIRPEVEQADLATLWERDKLANIDAETNEPLYDGEPLQMQHIIDALFTAANDRPN